MGTVHTYIHTYHTTPRVTNRVVIRLPTSPSICLSFFPPSRLPASPPPHRFETNAVLTPSEAWDKLVSSMFPRSVVSFPRGGEGGEGGDGGDGRDGSDGRHGGDGSGGNGSGGGGDSGSGGGGGGGDGGDGGGGGGDAQTEEDVEAGAVILDLAEVRRPSFEAFLGGFMASVVLSNHQIPKAVCLSYVVLSVVLTVC